MQNLFWSNIPCKKCCWKRINNFEILKSQLSRKLFNFTKKETFYRIFFSDTYKYLHLQGIWVRKCPKTFSKYLRYLVFLAMFTYISLDVSFTRVIPWGGSLSRKISIFFIDFMCKMNLLRELSTRISLVYWLKYDWRRYDKINRIS